MVNLWRFIPHKHFTTFSWSLDCEKCGRSSHEINKENHFVRNKHIKRNFKIAFIWMAVISVVVLLMIPKYQNYQRLWKIVGETQGAITILYEKCK